jgi:hypothetical protein
MIRESSHGGEIMGDENKGILGEWEARIMSIIMYHRMVCLWDVGHIIRRDVVGDKGFLFHVN